MLHTTILRASLLRRCANVSAFSSSSFARAAHPNSPMHLDPSLQALLKDVDISLIHNKGRSTDPPRELESFPVEQNLSDNSALLSINEETSEDLSGRKSPAAYFGSQGIGAVELPFELQSSIDFLIHESDKPQLHSDAKRLFYDTENGPDDEWDAKYDKTYRSHRQAERHSERDGTAFASVVLPAHYSAITAVLDHAQRRLGNSWHIKHIIDWGAGTGSGLWASLYTFQEFTESASDKAISDLQISNSSVVSYLGIDKREGLIAIGKRLLRNVDLGNMSLRWQKTFKADDKIRRSDGHETIALSAFMLASLRNPLDKKALVKEMWESGAHTIVLIDHNTKAGFEAIAEAREYLLKMGRKEFEDTDADEWNIRGSHVVAPCPHDGACPLYHPGASRLICGFTQRLQRPAFVRRTKHSGVGHEDIEYSYVVIRRGTRPVGAMTNIGRVGDVGKRAIDKETKAQAPTKELMLHDGQDEAPVVAADSEQSVRRDVKHPDDSLSTTGDVETALRLEAYSWPRLVFPPLKKSGHIILDCCTAEGKIMRLTIPKSQGKQPYYDARKSSWGDIFPHEPKNPPQERNQPTKMKRAGETSPTKGDDIGKRGSSRSKDTLSYDAISKTLKEQRQRSRRDKVHVQNIEAEQN